ncbi:sec7 domain protein [Ichthyophthirius multifiliis]|uniref:Sec7 domain protein n=1 Tax=Ichthyophthirius multifiliis TaxID=5932 RepID=G0QJ39_ICHMU|nr:sec7 domain protein [Ichthyophthirius multifiliis]EGR34763.1 sec7 domain protein [Ichthyophthirius multifiliis]|eukprot:XP_004040067.1 sec7 domain protein [Ichthyophthirius multifiliis]
MENINIQLEYINQQKQQNLYQEIIGKSYENIKKNIPKKYIAFREYINQMKKQMLLEKHPHLNANQYFLIYKLAIETKIQRLVEVSINAICLLTLNNFLDGNCEDYAYNINLEDFKEQLEQNKQNQVNKNRTLLQTIIETIIQTVSSKEETIQLNVIQIIQQLGTHTKTELHNNYLTLALETLIQIYSSKKKMKQKDISPNNNTNSQEEVTQGDFSGYLEDLNFYIKQQNQYLNKKLTYQNICYNQLQNIIDNVCIKNNEIINEIQQKAGKFGWCSFCRNTANLFCKQLNVGICSQQCKNNLIEQEQKINIEGDNYVRICKIAYQDCLTILSCLCYILTSEQEQMINLMGNNNKYKIIVLKILYSIFDLKGSTFFEKQQAIQIIKNNFFNGILKCSLHNDSNILQQAFSIFLLLIIYHKKELKNEILIFLNEIIIKLLQSTNSSSSHKYLALQVINNYFQQNQIVIDFYVNYDCSPNQAQLTYNIVQILSLIATGYYQNPEFQLMVSPQQEQSLSTYAIETLFIKIKSIYEYYENYQVLNKNNNLDDNSNNIHNTQIEETKDNIQIPKIDTALLQNQIDRQHYIKIETQRAISKFNKKPNTGIKHLVEAGILQADDAKGIAKFQKAQIVDRILQKFGDKFQSDNPDIFSSASGAYTLSFLLIMLQTDLYNPQVKEKMKLEDFIKIAKGIEGENLENEYLSELYNSIKKSPLALHEKAKIKQDLQETLQTSVRKKQHLFLQESLQMIQNGKKLLQKNQSQQKFVQANSIYYLAPLIECISQEILKSLKYAFQNYDEENNYTICVESFQCMIYLYGQFNMEYEKDLFLEEMCNLYNFSLFSFNNFQKKHIFLINSLLSFSLKIGNFLRKGWYFILNLTSKLHQVGLIRNKKIEIKKSTYNLDEIQINQQQNLFFDTDIIEMIFINSSHLDGESIQDFVIALCRVSYEELMQNSQVPIIFSLQKVVEIAELNMGRIVIIWNRIWITIRCHFAEIGCSQNITIAMNAVDNLKQLSQKLFGKKERFNLTFQKDFLKVFEIIFLKQNIFIKIFILDCIKAFCTNFYRKIKSGWKIIFNIINYAIQDNNTDLSKNAFQILKLIIDQDLNIIYDLYADIVQCLTSLSKNKEEKFAFTSIQYVEQYIKYIFENESTKTKDSNKIQKILYIFKQYIYIAYWFPLLGVLTILCGDQRHNIQAKGMDSLFNILSLYGHVFTIEFWRMIFQGVLRPLFDEMQFTFQQMIFKKQSKELIWLKNSINKAYTDITKLLFDYYDKLGSLLGEFIKTYENCINNTNDQIIQLSVNASKNTIMSLGIKFIDSDWDIILDFFDRIIRITTPVKLQEINFDEKSQQIVQDLKGKRRESFLKLKNQKISFEVIYSQSEAHILILKVIKDVLDNFHEQLNMKQLDNLQNIIKKSNSFAIKFNKQIFLRYCIWKLDLIQIINNQQQNYQKFQQQQMQLEDQDEDTIEFIIENIQITEMQRHVRNYRAIIYETVLPILESINLNYIENKTKEIYCLLFDMIQYTQNKSFSQIVCYQCKNCNKCGDQEEYLDIQVRKIMKSFYLFIFESTDNDNKHMNNLNDFFQYFFLSIAHKHFSTMIITQNHFQAIFFQEHFFKVIKSYLLFNIFHICNQCFLIFLNFQLFFHLFLLFFLQISFTIQRNYIYLVFIIVYNNNLFKISQFKKLFILKVIICFFFLYFQEVIYFLSNQIQWLIILNSIYDNDFLQITQLQQLFFLILLTNLTRRSRILKNQIQRIFNRIIINNYIILRKTLRFLFENLTFRSLSRNGFIFQRISLNFNMRKSGILSLNISMRNLRLLCLNFYMRNQRFISLNNGIISSNLYCLYKSMVYLRSLIILTTRSLNIWF